LLSQGGEVRCDRLLFEPITLEPEDAGDLTIVGEFVRVAS